MLEFYNAREIIVYSKLIIVYSYRQFCL